MLDRDDSVRRAAGTVPGATALVADVTDETSARDAVAVFAAGPALLVNNAGVVRKGTLLGQPLAVFRQVLEVNLVGALVMARAVVPGMIERGIGAIVNVSSIAAVTANAGGGAYGPSKAGLANLTEQMAIEWAAFGIRVNAVAPGMLDGGMATAVGDPDALAARRAMVPQGRLGTVEDVADVILFLASDAARYVTGQQLLVDGGLSRAVMANLPMPTPAGWE
jgi:NAD(P)-dependent dehydrogenase (short-subunit alcohol dehydrogenase family)